MILYHGTTKENAGKIIFTGFKKGDCSDYGMAVYFSPLKEWAQEYSHNDGVVIEAIFKGVLLDLSNAEHFEIYKNTGNNIPKRFDGIKDGNIIAITNLKKITKATIL